MHLIRPGNRSISTVILTEISASRRRKETDGTAVEFRSNLIARSRLRTFNALLKRSVKARAEVDVVPWVRVEGSSFGTWSMATRRFPLERLDPQARPSPHLCARIAANVLACYNSSDANNDQDVKDCAADLGRASMAAWLRGKIQ